MKDDLKTSENGYHTLFKLLLASSLLKTDKLKSVNYLGIYPSSSVKDFEEELIYRYYASSKFALNNTTQKHPILLRSAASIKRHASGTAIDRKDPNLQLSAIHVNPYYQGKIRGKSILILDDFTTYGTSFAVANALLKKAGAASVFGVAMGK